MEANIYSNYKINKNLFNHIDTDLISIIYKLVNHSLTIKHLHPFVHHVKMYLCSNDFYLTSSC